MKQTKSIYSLVLLALTVSACSSITFSREYDSTVDLMGRAQAKCEKHVNDALSASRECFPILTNQKLLVRVTKTTSYGKVVGEAGQARYEVECKPTEIEMKRLLDTPGSIKLGESYWMTGQFKAWRMFGATTTFDLDNCTFESPEQK